LGAELGVGLDWFPARRVSIGGHVGVRGFAGSLEVSDDAEQDFTGISTLNSGIRVHLYF
jgi:hypothetical protein